VASPPSWLGTGQAMGLRGSASRPTRHPRSRSPQRMVCRVTTYIHISRQIIKDNLLHRRNNPVIRVEVDGTSTHCMEVEIDGPSRVVYRPDDPRRGGTRVWIETDAPTRMIGTKE